MFKTGDDSDMQNKITLAFILGLLIVMLYGATQYLTEQTILNKVMTDDGSGINVYQTTEQALNAVYNTDEQALNIEMNGNINPEYFFQELLQSEIIAGANSGSSVYFRSGFTIFSTDSFTIDSLRIVWYTNHNDVYIDSMNVKRGITRNSPDYTILFADGTNYGVGTATYVPITYIVNQTVSHDWRVQIQFFVATAATAGIGQCYSSKAYCHY